MFILKIILNLGFLGLVSVLFWYQGIKGDYFLTRSQANYIRVVPYLGIRGSIYDRNGVVLAADQPIFNISVIPYQIRFNKEEIFSKLSKIVGISYDQIAAEYKNNYINSFSPVIILRNITKEKALYLKELFADNLIIQDTPQRFYFFNEATSHLLGYVKQASVMYDRLKKYGYKPQQRIGFLGIEQFYDGYLSGKDGGEVIEVDSRGRLVGFLGKRLAKRGENIKLSIDIRMQDLAYKVLAEKPGVIIVLDINNGEVLTLASSPGFEPNLLMAGKLKAFLENNSFINRAIQSVYPLGSVIKPFLGIAGLEEKTVSPKTIFVCQKIFPLGGIEFSCMHRHGPQNVTEAIVHSCNVYFFNLGLKLGIKKIEQWAENFGLGKLTGIDLPYEKKGVVPNPQWKKHRYKRSWVKGDTVNTSIGQGYWQVTPLQAVCAMAAIANGGYLVQPHLLIQVADWETSWTRKEKINISNYSLNIIRQALRAVVEREDGTAHFLNKLPFEVAGKTGTAEAKGEDHAWFVGYFPFKKPKYAFCVFLEHRGSSFYAVKLAKKFLDLIYKEKIILNDE